MNLYEATMLANLKNFIDEETGEIDISGLDSANMALLEKQRAVAAYILNLESDISILSSHIKKMEEKMSSMISKHKNLKSYLETCMKIANTKEFEAEDCTFKVKLFLGRDVSVHIEDGAKIPAQYNNPPPPPRPPSPDKSALKIALENGEEIPGVSLVKKDRLTFS